MLKRCLARSLDSANRVHTSADLQDIAERLGKPFIEIEQDFLLVKIAVQLQSDFPDQLCTKDSAWTEPGAPRDRSPWLPGLSLE